MTRWRALACNADCDDWIAVKASALCVPRPLRRSALTPSLHRLSYRGSGDTDQLCLQGPTEYAPLEDSVQSPKRRVSNKRQDSG
jgi:hypothetical protein